MARRHSHAEEEKIADQWIYVPPLNFSCSSLFSIDHGSLVRPFGSVEREQWPDPSIGIQWSEKIRGFVSCCVRWNEAFRSFLIFLCVRNISLSTIEIELDRSCFLSFYLAPLFYFSDTTIKEGGGGGGNKEFTCLREKKGKRGKFHARVKNPRHKRESKICGISNPWARNWDSCFPARRIKGGATLRCYKEHVRSGIYIHIYIFRWNVKFNKSVAED